MNGPKVVFAGVLAIMMCLVVRPVLAGTDKEAVGTLLDKHFEKGNVKFDYLLYLPQGYGKDDKAVPLVLFLHGAGDKLANLKRFGLPKQIERKKDVSFILVAPQNPGRGWDSRGLKVLLDDIEAQYKVDRDRVYLTGLSMGGYGTWALAAAAPEHFAAIIPICGGGSTASAAKLKDLPIWVFHGAKDEVVPASRSEAMVKALKDAGAEKVKFTLYPDAGHNAWTATYNNPEVWDWLLKQSRSGSTKVAQEKSASKEARLRVLVPERYWVRVRINNEPIFQRGSEWTIIAPTLPQGKQEHEVTATWRTNNYTKFSRTRKVAPAPGETITVDLRQTDPKNPDHIEIRYVPTPEDVVERMCKLAKVGKEDVVYDLGCGDGRIVITAITDFGAKRGVGVDLDPEHIKECRANAKEKKVEDRVEFRVEDVLKIKDLSKATVVMLYMGEDVNLRLRPILQKTLPPGARIVSHRFGMGDWKADQTETFAAKDRQEYTLLLWTIR